VAVSCATKSGKCCCDVGLPMMRDSWGIENGMRAKTVFEGGVCENNTHRLTFRNATNPEDEDVQYLSPDDAISHRITCQKGIFVLSLNTSIDGWQISNATCAPEPPERTDKIAEMGNDSCSLELFPNETVLDGDSGVCPRDNRKLIIRGVNETGEIITFDNDNANVLTFDVIRGMWVLEYNDWRTWLVAVSCAEINDTCGCAGLPMVDVDWVIENGVPAQVDSEGACEDRTHELTYLFTKSPSGLDVQFLSPDDARSFRIACQAGIWILSYLDNHDGWQITSATCAPVSVASAK
ncbi:hypothetical protein PMAYCL1PPCAC_03284, partial [Pristionchus mayeri]